MESYESLVASGLTPIKPTPIVNGRVPPPYAPSMGRALVGTIPPEMQLDADFAENQYGGQVPSYRLMPPASSGKAAVNAAAQSTQTVVQQSSVGSGLLLETLGSKNPNQSVLNLQGTAVVGVDAAGNVTIDGSGDGLIHGETPWESDPSYVSLRDDFGTGGITEGTVGELRWSFGGTTVGISPFYAAGLNFGGMGEYGWANIGTTADAPAALFLVNGPTDYYQQLWALLENPGWKAIFVWRFHRDLDNINASAPNFLKKSIYVGLAGMNASASVILSKSRPNIFIGARFDTDTTAPSIGDTTIHLEAVQNPIASTRNNVQGSVFDTGIVPTEDAYYRLEIQCVSAGVVTMSINGSAPQTFTLSQMTTTAGASSEVQGLNGQAHFFVSTTFFGASGGSKFTVAGLTSPNTALNGSYINSVGDVTFQTFSALSPAIVSAAVVTGWTITGYPALIPFFSLGNSSAASPVTDLRMMVGYFGFIQNPGVGGGIATPDSTKARYF